MILLRLQKCWGVLTFSRPTVSPHPASTLTAAAASHHGQPPHAACQCSPVHGVFQEPQQTLGSIPSLDKERLPSDGNKSSRVLS